MKRSSMILFGVVALVAGLAACGSGADSTSTSASRASAPGSASKDTVEIRMFTFTPPELTIPAGTTVTWTNNDEILHTVTAGSGPDAATGAFDGQLDDAGSTFSFTFDKPGTYPYFCDRHATVEAMHGTIVVT